MQQYHCPASARSAGSAVADGDFQNHHRSRARRRRSRENRRMHATADTGGCTAASHGWLRIKTGGCNGHIAAASRAGILYASDTAATAQIVRDDCVINEAFHAFVRTLITYMKEDTQMIST